MWGLNKWKLVHMPDEDVTKGLVSHEGATYEAPYQLNDQDSISSEEVIFPEDSDKGCVHTLTR